MYIGDLHFVLPARNWSTLVAGILIIEQQVRLIMFSLNMLGLLHVLPLAVHLNYLNLDRQVGGTIPSKFYFLGFVVGPLLHA